MEDRKKVVKFKKRRGINIGVVLFLIIFIYLLINVFYYFTKEHLSIYEVTTGTTVDDSVAEGVILRTEKIYKAKTSGYVNYYQKDGVRVAKGTTIYSIDESKQVYDLLTSDSSEVDYTTSDIYTIKKEIQKFASNFSTLDYSKVTEYKEDISNTVTSVIFNNLLENMQDVLDSSSSTSTFDVIKSKKSGILTYYYDGYEKLTADEVTSESFDQDSYTSTQLRTSDLVSEGDRIYKLITSDEWSIVLQLSEDQYTKLSDLSTVSITILKDNFTLSVPVETFVGSDGGYYAELTMKKYMIRYMEDRFLTVELNYSQQEGLKIPKTAIVEKEFYLIPDTMFTAGGDSDDLGLVIETYDEKTGDVQYEFTTPTVYYDDGTYSYIATECFNYGDKLRNTETQETYQVTLTNSLQGVYNVNNGYAVFKKVVVLSENDEYYIVQANSTQYPDSQISKYDQIAADASTVTEDAIIY